MLIARYFFVSTSHSYHRSSNVNKDLGFNELGCKYSIGVRPLQDQYGWHAKRNAIPIFCAAQEIIMLITTMVVVMLLWYHYGIWSLPLAFFLYQRTPRMPYMPHILIRNLRGSIVHCTFAIISFRFFSDGALYMSKPSVHPGNCAASAESPARS